MTCKLLPCCQFFDGKMENMPNTADYIMKKHCYGDFASCNRYRIYLESGGEDIPLDFDPDSEEVAKVIRCLRQRQFDDLDSLQERENQRD